MPKSRLEVQTYLEELLGSKNVYYNPPESIKLEYPCIVYHLQDLDSTAADNSPYVRFDRYSITYIYRSESDSDFSRKLAETSGFLHDRNFKMDNLRHDAFTLTVY